MAVLGIKPPHIASGFYFAPCMSDEIHIPLPDPNTAIDWQGMRVQLDFHPNIKLTRKGGLDFAASITDCIEPQDVELETTEWKIKGGSTCEGIELHVTKRSLVFWVLNPQNGLEWYEEKLTTVLACFRDVFAPRNVLSVQVFLSGLIGLPNDSSVLPFLGGWVMALHPKKLDAMQRPMHILGVRMSFPPFEREGTKVDWGVDVKIETWGGDEKKLFLSADSVWDQVEDWSVEFERQVIARVPVVSGFLQERVIDFLRQPPFPNDGDGDDTAPEEN